MLFRDLGFPSDPAPFSCLALSGAKIMRGIWRFFAERGMMMKILIVDDNEDFRTLCRYELEDAGYEVVMAGTAARAMETFRKEKPELVILDIKLPDMDGIELLGRIKEIKNDVPVIMHTAFDYMYDLACDISDAYVVKSADFHELKSRIAQVIKSSTLQAGRSERDETERDFSAVTLKIRTSYLKSLRETGARDDASLSRMIDEALCTYLKKKKL
jgi:DNA-binding response OmpR family regulator